MKMHIFRNMLYKSFIKTLQKLLYIYIYFEFVLHKTWQTRPQSFTKNAEVTSIVPNSDSKWVNNCAGRFWTDTRGTIAVVHEQWLFLSGPLLIGQADILSRHWQSSCPTDWTLSNVSMSMLNVSSQVLLVSSSRYPDKWIVPGGGMEPEEEPNVAAVREVCEEVWLSSLGLCMK